MLGDEKRTCDIDRDAMNAMGRERDAEASCLLDDDAMFVTNDDIALIGCTVVRCI